MYYDSNTNVVYIAEAFQRYREVFDQLRGILADNGIKYKLIRGTRNVWCRDYFPLQVNDKFIKFVYKYQELIDKYPQLEVSDKCWRHLGNIVESNIVLDGGNCVRYGDKAIITDIVFRHNREMKKKVVLAELERLLEAQVIIVPKEPWEITGHSDGMVRWIDDKTVFVNDTTDKKFVEKLSGILTNKYGLNCVLFPCSYEDIPVINRKTFYKQYPDADTYQPSQGWYINYLRVSDLIIVGNYGVAKDKDAVAILKQYLPECRVGSVDCRDIGNLGGGLHCCTMNYRMAA